MAGAMSEPWPVPPHRPIEKLTENLWRVEGDVPGMGLKRVMSVLKLGDGRLVIHNAITLEPSAMEEIERFGEVAFVIVPNGFHRIDAPRFAARYPDAKVLCPPGASKSVAKKVRVDGTYEDLPRDGNVQYAPLAGLGDLEGHMLVKSESGSTVIVNDAVFNMPHRGGMEGMVFKHVTQSSGGPKITRVARFFLLKDKARFAAELRGLAATPDLRRVIVSHHEMITDVPADTLRAVAETL
jgi:hypothetical protein